MAHRVESLVGIVSPSHQISRRRKRIYNLALLSRKEEESSTNVLTYITTETTHKI